MQTKLTWILAAAAATLALPAAPGAAAASSPVPPECEASDLSAADQARCDFIARTPNICLRQGLSEDTQRWCDQRRFAGEPHFTQLRLARDGAVRSIHLIVTETGQETFTSYPYGVAFAGPRDDDRVVRIKSDELDGMLEGRPTLAGSAPAASGFATGLPIGWNDSTGATPGQCFNYTIATPSNNVQTQSFTSQSAAGSTAEQINVSATVKASFDLFEAEDTASFSDMWQASTFSSNQYYNFYSLYVLNSTVNSSTPLNAQGAGAGAGFATLCGGRYMAAVPVGMVATISINYDSSSSSTQTDISNSFEASNALASLTTAVDVATQQSSSNSYFTFSMIAYGGGLDATSALHNAYSAMNSSGQAFYALCAQGDTDACDTFQGNMGDGATNALTEFNSEVADLSGATNPDLSIFETFPAGVSGADIPGRQTLAVPLSVSDVLMPYAEELEDYVDLVNQVATLNNRANHLNGLIAADEAALNYVPVLDLTTTLRALGSKDDAALYAAARATLLDDLENCINATEDNVTDVCAPIINNQSGDAFDYFAADRPGNSFLAQQNTIALQYTVLYTVIEEPAIPRDVMYIGELPSSLSTGGVPLAGEAALIDFVTQDFGTNGADLVALEPGQPISTANLSDEVRGSGGTFTVWGLVNTGFVSSGSAPGAAFASSCTPSFADPCDIAWTVQEGGLTSNTAYRRIDGLFQ